MPARPNGNGGKPRPVRKKAAAPRLFSTLNELFDDLEHDWQIEQAIAALPEEAFAAARHDFRNWTHDGQSAPDTDDWRTWVIMAGRGFGKTRAGAEWVKAAVAPMARRYAQDRRVSNLRIALVAATIDDAKRIMIHGNSGLLKVAAPFIDKWRSTGPTLFFKGGAQATLYSGANPDALRGPEHHLAWCDELAKWEKGQETWDMLQLGMRLGDTPRVLVTTTPRGGGNVLSRILETDGTALTRGHTRGNIHLPPAFIEAVEAMYAGTRLGKQELEGELLSDIPGALWSVDLLERQRLNPPHSWGGEPRSGGGGLATSTAIEAADTPLRQTLRACHLPISGEDFTRTVIGVDPPTGAGTCGIVACAKDARGHFHVLADHSVTAVTPNGWAQKVAAAAAAHGARHVVAEDNQGGAMVKSVLENAERKMTVRSVTARTSKSDRAIPVATAFERGRVWLHGHFPQLEAQLCGVIAGGDYDGPGRSPDRADAMVWALSDLMEKKAEPRVRRL